MALTPDQVAHIARLARLALTEEESAVYATQLSQILDHAAKVKEIDTSKVPPTSHPVRLANVMRKDEPRLGLGPKDVLGEAPEAEDAMFKVPRIMDA